MLAPTAGRTRIVGACLWSGDMVSVPSRSSAATPTYRTPPASSSTAFTHPGLAWLLKPELVGYDACRMASAETVLELAAATPFSEAVFIGSMVPEPASGWPYVALLRTLLAGGSTAALAAAIVQDYAASVDVPDWCLVAVESAWSASRLRARGSAAELKATRPPSALDFFDAAAGADTYDDGDLVDLGALMRRLSVKSPSPVTDEVRTSLRQATFARRASGSLAGRDGLSVRVGMPPLAPGSYPTTPTWANFLPDL